TKELYKMKKQLEQRAVEASAAKLAHGRKINAKLKKLSDELVEARADFTKYEDALGKKMDDIGHPDASVRAIYNAAKIKKAQVDEIEQAIRINKEAQAMLMRRFQSSLHD